MTEPRQEEPASGLLLELSCQLPAPPEEVFGMLTDPAKVARWFGPRGFRMPEIELDPRAGGRYRFTIQPPQGQPFHVTGHFLEVVPPAGLAYTFWYEEPAPDDRETTVRLSLVADGQRTDLSMSHGLFSTEERLALHRDGWQDSLARLQEALESHG